MCKRKPTTMLAPAPPAHHTHHDNQASSMFLLPPALLRSRPSGHRTESDKRRGKQHLAGQRNNCRSPSGRRRKHQARRTKPHAPQRRTLGATPNQVKPARAHRTKATASPDTQIYTHMTLATVMPRSIMFILGRAPEGRRRARRLMRNAPMRNTPAKQVQDGRPTQQLKHKWATGRWQYPDEANRNALGHGGQCCRNSSCASAHSAHARQIGGRTLMAVLSVCHLARVHTHVQAIDCDALDAQSHCPAVARECSGDR